MTVAEQIRLVMRVQNISIRKAAEECGIDNSSLSRFLAGKSNLRSDLFLNLLKYLGIDISQELNRLTFKQTDNEGSEMRETLYEAFSSLNSISQRSLLRLLQVKLAEKQQTISPMIQRVQRELSTYTDQLNLRRGS